MSYEINYEIPVASSVDSDLEKLGTTSSKIRFLLGQGMTRKQVALKLNIRYQHVRNVEITPVKKQSA